MAKATLQFDLTNQDDCREFMCAANSLELALFVWELKHNILRKGLKDGLDAKMIVQLIHEHIEDLPFNIDDMIL